MDDDKIVKAFDKFVDDKFAESEDILRTQIKQAVNDHLKDTLSLKKDPIEIESDDPDNDNSDDPDNKDDDQDD